MLLMYRVLQYLCNTAEMKSKKHSASLYACQSAGYGYVICACVGKDSTKPCMHLYLNFIGNKNSTQSLFRDIMLLVL